MQIKFARWPLLILATPSSQPLMTCTHQVSTYEVLAVEQQPLGEACACNHSLGMDARTCGKREVLDPCRGTNLSLSNLELEWLAPVAAAVAQLSAAIEVQAVRATAECWAPRVEFRTVGESAGIVDTDGLPRLGIAGFVARTDGLDFHTHSDWSSADPSRASSYSDCSKASGRCS